MQRGISLHKFLGFLFSAIALPLASDYYMGILPNYYEMSLAGGGATANRQAAAEFLILGYRSASGKQLLQRHLAKFAKALLNVTRRRRSDS